MQNQFDVIISSIWVISEGDSKIKLQKIVFVKMNIVSWKSLI